MKNLTLISIGVDSWNRPVYEDENGKLFKDINCSKGNMRLATVYGGFDGEPDTPIEYIEKYKDVSIRIKRTKEQTIKYFKQLAHEFEKDAYRNDDPIAKAQSEAWELAAFEVKRNMQ